MARKTLTGVWPLVLASVGVWPGPAQAQTVEYYHLDAVGNVLAVTDSNGAVIEEHDYYPFGEECTTAPCAHVTGTQPKRFTGKERDNETGLDYFGARYYSAKYARFTTIDPVYTWKDNLGDPQKWNRYAYGRNNPFRYVDPDGRVIFDWTAFKGQVGEASHFGQEGYGYVVPAVSAVAAVGSVANDVLLAVGVGEGLQAIRGGLAANSVARTGLGLLEETGEASSRQAATGGARYFKPGPYAGDGVPVRGPGRLNAAAQKAVNEEGNAVGCHTCGDPVPGTKSGNWVGDHQPVSSLNTSGAPQKAFPHCTSCSAKQGGYASQVPKTPPVTPPQ